MDDRFLQAPPETDTRSRLMLRANSGAHPRRTSNPTSSTCRSVSVLRNKDRN